MQRGEDKRKREREEGTDVSLRFGCLEDEEGRVDRLSQRLGRHEIGEAAKRRGGLLACSGKVHQSLGGYRLLFVSIVHGGLREGGFGFFVERE